VTLEVLVGLIALGVCLFALYCAWALAAVAMSALRHRRLPVLTEADSADNCRPWCEKLTIAPVDTELEYRRKLDRNRRLAS
jgi:hypothetical protein